MRIAYIILAHKQPALAARLVSRLNASEASFFVHVDKKTEDATYREFITRLGGLPNVCFLKRHVCHWGEFGLVRATLEGIAEIVRRELPADYVVLLTGQDYPIKTKAYIDDFFERGGGRSYVSYDSVPSTIWTQADPRVKGWQVRLMGRPVLFPRRKLEIAAWPVVLVSYCLPRQRRFPRGYRPYTGSAYWAMTRACARLVDDVARTNRPLLRYFRYVCCPDELFFQTALLNSGLSSEIVDSDLHYIDWSAGGAHPATLTVDDLDRLAASPALFARKFDLDVDATVLPLIDERLLGVSPTAAASDSADCPT